MRVIYTCPKCGHDLTEYVTELGEVYRVACDECGWSEDDKKELIVRIPWGGNKYVPNTYTPIKDYMIRDYNVPEACRTCSNHLSNGGTGICHCILGLPKVTC